MRLFRIEVQRSILDPGSLALGLTLVIAMASAAFADVAPYDLTGPALEVKVTHGGVTLPISEVPNLGAGDQLWVKADLPPDHSTHYRLVIAFLRGATDPPPNSWFHQDETWNPKDSGLTVTVPAGAQQVMMFLAPQTGGDIHTLVGAVRGRPGAFVRASLDLNQASRDHSRLDAFLSSISAGDVTNPDRLKSMSQLLARSLMIKLNSDCFQKMAELQAACLMQDQASLVLSDGHSASMVEALTSGASSDLAMEVSATPRAGSGYYSPYVGAVMDMARIFDSIHTAQYQYIPSLTVMHDDHVVLLLNTPPSFHAPQSVLVAALPALESSQPPPFTPVDPAQIYCAERPDLILPVEGAPLAYSTRYAHDMVLRTKTMDGQIVDLPVRADAQKGGFVVDNQAIDPSRFDAAISGVIHGYWGFQPFNGPAFQLANIGPTSWRLTPEDQQSLIVGRDDVIHLKGQQAACVDSITLQQPSGQTARVTWTAQAPDTLTLTVPLTQVHAGPIILQVRQFGAARADTVALQAFAEDGHVDGFTLHAGDTFGVLAGERLDRVARLDVDGTSFSPGILSSTGGADALSMTADDAQAAARLDAGQPVRGKVILKDGRTIDLKAVIAPSRPAVSLIGKSVESPPSDSPISMELTEPNELATTGNLTFSIRAQRPARFSGREAIELATADGAASATLTLANGLILEDHDVAVATVDPLKAFGPSVYGPLRFRVNEDGAEGDWQALGDLVRLPALADISCPPERSRPCKLVGSNLFLLDAISDRPDFSHAVSVPEGYTGSAIEVPRPIAGHLYVRLRDDPKVVNRAVVSARHSKAFSSS